MAEQPYRGFKKGNVANPNGRPKGPMTNAELTKLIMQHKENRNQFTLGLFQRIDSLGDSLVSKAVDMAMEGNERMMLFIMDKLVNTNLMNRLEKKLVSKTVEDIDNSQQFVIEKMGDGDIDIDYGHQLVKTLALKRETINVKQLEDQVRKIVDESK